MNPPIFLARNLSPAKFVSYEISPVGDIEGFSKKVDKALESLPEFLGVLIRVYKKVFKTPNFKGLINQMEKRK